MSRVKWPLFAVFCSLCIGGGRAGFLADAQEKLPRMLARAERVELDPEDRSTEEKLYRIFAIYPLGIQDQAKRAKVCYRARSNLHKKGKLFFEPQRIRIISTPMGGQPGK